jgi:hypothetical protein
MSPPSRWPQAFALLIGLPVSASFLVGVTRLVLMIRTFRCDTICLRVSHIRCQRIAYLLSTSPLTGSKHCICSNLKRCSFPSSVQRSQSVGIAIAPSVIGRRLVRASCVCTCAEPKTPGIVGSCPGIRLRHLIRRKVANGTSSETFLSKFSHWRTDPACCPI